MANARVIATMNRAIIAARWADGALLMLHLTGRVGGSRQLPE